MLNYSTLLFSNPLKVKIIWSIDHSNCDMGSFAYLSSNNLLGQKYILTTPFYLPIS